MTKNVIKENNKYSLLTNKLSEIRDTLNSSDFDFYRSSSIMGGNSGIALFYFYYSKYMNDQNYYDKAYNIINNVFESLNSGKNHLSFSGGLAGIGWLVEHLEEQEFIDSDTNEILIELDELAYEKMKVEIESKNFDYLHGALGFGIYFLSRLKKNNTVKCYLIELVDKLGKEGELDVNGGLKWPPLTKKKDNESVISNLSLSHGMASIIVFLSKVYKQNIQKEKTTKLIHGAITFILQNQLDPLKYYSIFPCLIDNSKSLSSSRLAWCYGDLGIGMAIYYAGKVTGNSTWENTAIEILIQTTKRRDDNNTNVVDAGLCHGSAGIAHIYNKIYRYTKIETFKEAADFWFLKTVRMATFNDGLAGFKTWRQKEGIEYINDPAFLEGIAGIGLALISYVSDIEPAWDECLLLS